MSTTEARGSRPDGSRRSQAEGGHLSTKSQRGQRSAPGVAGRALPVVVVAALVVLFAIARRVVGATQQYITYNAFLPTFEVNLTPYRSHDGYNRNFNATLSTQFAVALVPQAAALPDPERSVGERPAGKKRVCAQVSVIRSASSPD